MQFAVKQGMIKDDPTAGIKNVKVKTDGFPVAFGSNILPTDMPTKSLDVGAWTSPHVER